MTLTKRIKFIQRLQDTIDKVMEYEQEEIRNILKYLEFNKFDEQCEGYLRERIMFDLWEKTFNLIYNQK